MGPVIAFIALIFIAILVDAIVTIPRHAWYKMILVGFAFMIGLVITAELVLKIQ